MERLTKAFEAYKEVSRTVKDPRFGIRKLPVSKEKPLFFSYPQPGRGPNGESSN